MASAVSMPWPGRQSSGGGRGLVSRAGNRSSQAGIGRPKRGTLRRMSHGPSQDDPLGPQLCAYQASSLILSRCYVESRDRLSCVSCHDPHRDLETRAAVYESKCRKCHASSRSIGQVQTKEPGEVANVEIARTVCRINSQNGCLDCHMPRIKNAVPRTEFTDHQIRVRRN